MLQRIPGLRWPHQRSLRFALISALLLSACDVSVSTSCEEVEEDAIHLSEDRLLKITGSELVERSDAEIVCRGLGIYSDGTEVMTRYRSYIDEDGDIWTAYDTDEAEQAEEDRRLKALEKVWDQAYDEAREEMRVTIEEAQAARRW